MYLPSDILKLYLPHLLQMRLVKNKTNTKLNQSIAFLDDFNWSTSPHGIKWIEVGYD